MDSFKKFSKIKKSKSVCLITHIEPDTDALSSMVVLRDFLLQKFKIPCVDMFAEGKIPNNCLDIIDGLEINSAHHKCYDVSIILDCPNPSRTGVYESLYHNANIKVNIDHHATNSFKNCIHYFSPVSSTCEIVYLLLKAFKYKFSSSQLGKLYAGILTDTDGFSVGAITNNTFKIAGACIDSNISVQNIYKQYLKHNSLLNQKLYALSVNNIKTVKDDNLIITYIDHTQAKKLKVKDDDYYGIINQLNTIYTAKLVCLIYPKKNSYYVSLRAKEGYDVATIASKYGGGGHIRAAAFTSSDSIENIIKQMLKEFKAQIKDIKNRH